MCLYIRRGCSAIFCGLSCSRLFNYGVFFCVCVASLLCANNSPPPTESNEGCAPMFINHCPKHCGIFVPCSA